MGFNSVDAGGNPATPIVNQLVNFGMEYVWHCHILSHEEMDMMRPVAVALPPNQVTDLTFTRDPAGPVTLTWTDNSTNETGFRIQQATDAAFTANVVTTTVPANSTAWGSRRMPSATDLYFRVQAYNAAGPSAWVNATPFPITMP
jgi:hypothetical protein